jgi:hypothetical protein
MTEESWFNFCQGLEYLSSQKSPYLPWGTRNTTACNYFLGEVAGT